MATHSSILAWRIPWQRSLMGYSPWGGQESNKTECLTLSHPDVLVKGNRALPVLTLRNTLIDVWPSPFAIHLELSQHC